MLSLVALVLAGLARGVLRHTVAATVAEDRLQDRYAERSLETLLAATPSLLDAANRLEPAERVRLGEGTTKATGRVELGWTCGREERERRLVAADEQAKLNVNALQQRDPERLEAVLSDLFAEVGLRVQPEPRPLDAFALRLNVVALPPFTSHAQLVRREDAAALVADPAFPRLMDVLTLSGDGRLRGERAAPGLVDWVLSPETRGERIGEPDLRREERLAIQQRLTGTSSAFSVRMTSHVGSRAGAAGSPPVTRSFLLVAGEVAGSGGGSSAPALREVSRVRW